MSEKPSYEQVAQAMVDLGMPAVENMRDPNFHYSMGKKADALIKEIEVEMGGPMPEIAKSVLYTAIEKAGCMTGPQLEIVTEDETPTAEM